MKDFNAQVKQLLGSDGQMPINDNKLYGEGFQNDEMLKQLKPSMEKSGSLEELVKGQIGKMHEGGLSAEKKKMTENLKSQYAQQNKISTMESYEMKKNGVDQFSKIIAQRKNEAQAIVDEEDDDDDEGLENLAEFN